MPRENAVITGVGILSSIGIGQSAFFDALLDRRSGIRSLADRTDGDATPGPDDAIDGVWVGGPIVDFEPKKHVRPRKALKVMCREIQMAFASAYLAIEHAGLSDSLPASDGGLIPPDRIGAIYGSEIFFNPPGELIDSIKRSIDEQGNIQVGRFGQAARKEVMPLWMLKYLPNMPACQVGISINAQGPNNSLVLGDVSGPAALLEAESYLGRGIADVMMVGASGTRIGATRLSFRGDLPILVRGDLSIEDTSQPHDPNAMGVVGGEGAASILIETAKHARDRGATVLAKILATASRFSPTPAMASHERNADLQPSQSRGATAAIALAIDGALKSAGVSADQIGLIVSHAMGDRQVDAGEAGAIRKCGINCPAVAVAASIGHTGVASGMINVVTGVLAIASKTVPPTRNADVNPQAGLVAAPKPLESPYVICLSHTTEGNAMAILLGQ